MFRNAPHLLPSGYERPFLKQTGPARPFLAGSVSFCSDAVAQALAIILPLRMLRALCLLFVVTLLATGSAGAQDAAVQDTTLSSILPLVLIETDGQAIPDEPKVMARMRVVDNGPGRRNKVGDPPSGYEGWVGIELRGSSSQRFPKKQYSVETRHEDASNRNVALLGFPEENDWVLHAPYSDKSLMRNALAYEIARRTGRYAPRTRFCEVLLDGDYRGVYLLVEAIKDDGDRVDLADTDEVGGGFLAKLDKRSDDDETWPSRDPATGQRVHYQFDDPEADELTAAQRDEIEAAFDTLEAATIEGDVQSFVDLDSVVDYIIANEIAKNIDAYRISFFLHRPEAGAPIHAGPVWDFNIAFGNADYGAAARPAGLHYEDPPPSDAFPIPSWWSRVVESEPFQARVRSRWTELRAGPLATDALLAWIDATAEQLDAAQTRNFERWPILDRDIWPNAHVGGSYAAEVDYLRSWLTERLTWLDGVWLTATPAATSE